MPKRQKGSDEVTSAWSHTALVDGRPEGREGLRRSHQDAGLWAAAIEHLPVGAFIMSVGGRLVLSNRHGRRMLAEGRGLMLTNGRVEVVAHDDVATFYAAVSRAIDSAADGTFERIVLGLPSRGQLLQAVIAGLPGLAAHPEVASQSEPDGPLVLVFLRRLGPRTHFSEPAIAKLLGLTLAEAKVIAALCHGTTVSQYAEQHGVSPHTVRNQIKSALSKSGAKRQAELVRRVMSSLFGSDL